MPEVKDYLIISDNGDSFSLVEKVRNFQELLIRFAKHTGDNSSILRNALKGNEDLTDLVNIYNALDPTCYIDAIIEIKEILYEEDNPFEFKTVD